MDDNTPFDLEVPDENSELGSLTRALCIAKGFALFFVSCNPAERDRLMTEAERRLTGLQIRHIPVQSDIRSLLPYLHAILDETLPDILFIYGMESWISAVENPKSIPFLLNLNAARNHFYVEVPRPIVFWVPPFLLTLIRQAAPDFFSVHSGLYTFSGTPAPIIDSASVDDFTIAGLPYNEKQERIETLSGLLQEYEALPQHLRNPLEEARLLASLAALYFSIGYDAQAKTLLNRTLEITEKHLGPEHPDTATNIYNLALLYAREENIKMAEDYYNRALKIRERSLGPEHLATAQSLHTLGMFFSGLHQYEKAKELLNRAYEIRRKQLDSQHPDIARSFNNLAILSAREGHFAEAEALSSRALEIREKVLGPEHPDTANSLNTQAQIYVHQGRYAEAEPLTSRAIRINEQTLGRESPLTAIYLSNYGALLHHLGREAESIESEHRAAQVREAWLRTRSSNLSTL